MISQVSPLGGCCELETHPSHGIPSTLLLRVKIYFQINSPFGVRLQNVQMFYTLRNTNNKRSYKKENRRGRLNLKNEILINLSIFYISIIMKMQND